MKIHSNLTLTNLQTRVELAGDSPGRGALTLALKGTMGVDEVKMLFSTESQYKKTLGHFWDKDGDLTISDLNVLPLTTEVVGGNAMISTPFGEKHEFNGVTVKEVKITALPDRKCEVAAKMSVYPDKESLFFLFNHQRKEFEVTCTPGQMHIEDGIAAEKEKAKAGGDSEGGDDEQLQSGDIKPGDTDAEENPFAGMNVE